MFWPRIWVGGPAVPRWKEASPHPALPWPGGWWAPHSDPGAPTMAPAALPVPRVLPNHAKKKSAWRKLATAFNISDDIVEEEIIRDDQHRIISAKFVVKATLPNGRYSMGTGDCSIYDKINKKSKRVT